MIWTRIIGRSPAGWRCVVDKTGADPLNGGGMSLYDVSVRWEVAFDEGFRHIVTHGVEFARYQLGHSVHMEVEGLEPNTVYYCRFKTGPEIRPVGRAKTLPPFAGDVAKISFAFASCQNWQNGYYTLISTSP